MAANVACLLKLMAAILVVGKVRSKDDENESLKECAGTRHVCTTLIRYPDKYTADEGPYCRCSVGECGDTWQEDEDDERALTWKHYERGHLKVQYRFCTPVMDRSLQMCKSGERAAVVETEVKSWNPYLQELRCRCRDGVLHLTGWKKEGRVWKYFYECNKRECRGAEDVCADIHVDTSRKEEIVKEVIFKCSCPQGEMCPTKLKDESSVKGSMVSIKCELIKQSSKKKD